MRGRPFVLGFRVYLPTHQRVVGVAVSAVVAARTEDTVKKGSWSDNKIRLVPVAESYLGWRQDSPWLGLVETAWDEDVGYGYFQPARLLRKCTYGT